MAQLQDKHPTVNEYLDDPLLIAASRKGSEEFETVETLLKGKEIELPDGQSFFDKDGNTRHNVRVRWFDGDATTYQEAFLGPENGPQSYSRGPDWGRSLDSVFARSPARVLRALLAGYRATSAGAECRVPGLQCGSTGWWEAGGVSVGWGAASWITASLCLWRRGRSRYPYLDVLENECDTAPYPFPQIRLHRLRFTTDRRIIYPTHQERADAPPTCLPGQGGTRKGMWPTRQLIGPNHVCVCLALLRVFISHRRRDHEYNYTICRTIPNLT